MEFIFTWSEIMDKTCSPKDMKRDKMKLDFRVQDGIGNLIVQNR